MVSEVVAALHQFIGEDHGFTQSAAAESHVDQLSDLFFLEGLVQYGERQARRKNFERSARPTVVYERTIFSVFSPVSLSTSNSLTRTQQRV